MCGNVIYAGMGETTIRIDVSYGDGLYRSTDAGRTWAHMGLAETRHIGEIRVHPTDPDTLWVAAFGHALYEAPGAVPVLLVVLFHVPCHHRDASAHDDHPAHGGARGCGSVRKMGRRKNLGLLQRTARASDGMPHVKGLKRSLPKPTAALAIDDQIVSRRTAAEHGMTVALLPPVAGG